MRKSREEAAESRARILVAAARLFRAQGPDSVSVAEVMKDAGMTHGGFYKHFASKDDLLAAAIRAIFEEKRALVARPTRQAADAALADYAEDYLSLGHVETLEAGCPIAGLSLDALRARPVVQKALAEGTAATIADLAFAKGDTGKGEAAAVRDLMVMVGAVVLARSVDDAAMRNLILEEARKLRRDL